VYSQARFFLSKIYLLTTRSFRAYKYVENSKSPESIGLEVDHCGSIKDQETEWINKIDYDGKP